MTSPQLDYDRLRAEVISLSCYLTAFQGSRSKSHPNDSQWRFLNDLSTLLSIGNSANYEARNVNAVLGSATDDGIDYLVFVENAKQDPVSVASVKFDLKTGTQSNQEAVAQDPSTLSEAFRLLDIYPSAERGMRILREWDLQVNGVPKVQNNFQFPEHLRKLLDVILALGDDSDTLLEFDMYMHHVAYRKLGWRVHEFLTHWGKSPLDILSENLDPRLKVKTFEINGSEEVIRKNIEIDPISATSSGLVYSVDGKNASRWVKILNGLWCRLADHLLVDKSETRKRVRKDSLSPEAVEDVVVIIAHLESTLPILKHLLSAKRVAGALADAENKVYHQKSLQADEDITLFQERQEDHSGTELELVDFPVKSEESIDRILRAVKTVLAWHISSCRIYGQAHRFRQGNRRFSEFRYADHALKPHGLSLDTFSSLINSWRVSLASPYEEDKIKRIFHSTLDAKVHAEAALMHWVSTKKDLSATQSWPIGVSKKCCQLCWLLHEAHNAKHILSPFVLPGSHATYYPWVPPPGLPIEILQSLHTSLIASTKKMVRTHSRHSSADSADIVSFIPEARSQVGGGLAPFGLA